MNYVLKHAEENMPIQHLNCIKSNGALTCFQASNIQTAYYSYIDLTVFHTAINAAVRLVIC